MALLVTKKNVIRAECSGPSMASDSGSSTEERIFSPESRLVFVPGSEVFIKPRRVADMDFFVAFSHDVFISLACGSRVEFWDLLLLLAVLRHMETRRHVIITQV